MGDDQNEGKVNKSDEEKEESNNSSPKSNEEPKIIEKVVYKVVHVPYYYPVPVDAEYYYKNQDRFLRQPDKFNEQFLENMAPPPHSYYYRRSRELNHRYYNYPTEPSRHRYSRSPSPKYYEHRYMHRRSRSNSPVSHKEKDREHRSKINGDDREKEISENNDKKNENESHHEEQRENEEKLTPNLPVLKLEQNDKKENLSDEKSDEESPSRRKKRLLMTFPYDQRHKDEGNKKENLSEKPDQSVPDEFIRHDMHHYKRPDHYYSSHPPSPPNTPYVMVPMRPVDLHRPEYMHERRCHNEFNSHRDEKLRYNDMKNERVDNIKNEDRIIDDQMSNNDDDPNGDIRYHTNGRRVRTVFTRQQLLTLNNVFQKHPFVSGERMSELSSQLGLDRKIVKIWFQNKRQNARKKGSLFEKTEEYYYDYHERYGHRSTPPTMAEGW